MGTTVDSVVAFEGELNAIVEEYLQFCNYDQAHQTFCEECEAVGKPIYSADSKPRVNETLVSLQNDMMMNFELGQRDTFLQLWEDHLPQHIRDNDSVAQKLEFYLNIYFAIYPVIHGTGDPREVEEGMSKFKAYIETRGSNLSQTTEFLPFYALPFVPNPRSHPSYKELFSETWVPDLQVRLEKFLTLALDSTPQPRLFEIYNGSQGPSEELQQQLAESERRTQTYIKRYNKVQADYHNLIGITAELVDTLEAVVRGAPITPEYLSEICSRLFSSSMRQSMDLTRPGTAAEILRQSIVPSGPLVQQYTPARTLPHQHMAIPEEPAGPSVLDYKKIRADLVLGGDHLQALLLQALRWKLTRASSAKQRDDVLRDYIDCDLLGCSRPGQHRDSIQKLLSSRSETVRQYAARLYNTFASLSEGRSYLSLDTGLLAALLDNLRADPKDSIIRENVLGALQKLSLRRNLQSVMISEGLIQWLVSVLEDNDALSDYTLEYSVALLMNLCLRSSGKQKCQEDPHKILKVLSDLLGHENTEIIPYVNGALYSILALPPIREEARAMAMEEILKTFVRDGEADMNRQIEFIIKQLNSNEEPDDLESDDEEDDDDEEDQDAMEADLDKNEVLRPRSGELQGDRLLNNNYADKTQRVAPAKKKRSQLSVEEVLTRPVTPGQMRGGGGGGGGGGVDVHASRSFGHKNYDEPRNTHSSSGRKSAPPTPRPLSANHRPPTRSGNRPNSRPGTQDTPRVPPDIKTDDEASNVVARILGQEKKVAAAANDSKSAVRPSQRAVEKVGPNADFNEYGAAFNSRPRVLRTPEPGVRPISRGLAGDGPTPRPQMSDGLPTSRPNTGARSPGKRSASGGKPTPRR